MNTKEICVKELLVVLRQQCWQTSQCMSGIRAPRTSNDRCSFLHLVRPALSMAYSVDHGGCGRSLAGLDLRASQSSDRGSSKAVSVGEIGCWRQNCQKKERYGETEGGGVAEHSFSDEKRGKEEEEAEGRRRGKCSYEWKESKHGEYNRERERERREGEVKTHEKSSNEEQLEIITPQKLYDISWWSEPHTAAPCAYSMVCGAA